MQIHILQSFLLENVLHENKEVLYKEDDMVENIVLKVWSLGH